MKTHTGIVLLVALLLSATALAAEPVAEQASERAAEDSVVTPTSGDEQYIVYYLHGDRRCATCMKLEAYSHEAITTGFADALEDSSVVWRVVNFDEEENEHYVKDYKLYSQSVVISHVKDGEEVGWKNLDRIWKLVGDQEEFIAYVQEETKAFIDGEEQE